MLIWEFRPLPQQWQASAKQWDKLVTPAILCGTLGYAIATFIGVALANWLY